MKGVWRGLRPPGPFWGWPNCSWVSSVLGKMIGLDLPANFDGRQPARQLPQFLNLMVTMFVCGLWHGASWHFELWGMYHGAALALHNAWGKSPVGQKWAALPFSRWVDISVTNVFVAYGWLLFFYPLDQVAKISQHLFQF